MDGPTHRHTLSGTTATEGEIADTLYISPKTVENHVSSIYRKVGAKNRVQLFRLIRANALEAPRP